MRLIIPLTCVLGFCLFALFAFFQANDNSDAAVYNRPSTTDVVLWIAFYASIALLHAVGLFRSVPVLALVFGVLLCVLALSFSAPGLWRNFAYGDFTIAGEGMQASAPHVEQSREFIGAAIALVSVCFLAYFRRWLNHHQS